MDFDSRPELPTDNQAEITGRVEVKYSNYKINEGIPDSFFEEE
jgi:outer membrane lipoprotein-sorting protein